MIIRLFPWILLSASTISFFFPYLFTWFSGLMITIGLGLIMVGMGLELAPSDFRLVLNTPKIVIIGVILQFTIMPLLGFLIASILELPDNFYAGLILVACCPGGTASNVVVYLARGNLALSVVLTSISTLLAVILTPMLTSFYLGTRVEVDSMGLVFSSMQVILLPVGVGLLLNRYLPNWASQGRKFSGVISVLFITMIVASVIGAGRDAIIKSGHSVILACIILHSLGFFLGFTIVKLILRLSESDARTISIEVGMQNSGLGVVLARENFPTPETAIPSAISSLTHSIIGSILASFWRKSSDLDVDATEPA
ncbi:bile acid:sodium symporter family protein [Leptospira sp. GIMC2001]|uniref:bile acid:sodium symporter family protein n=1 Tax=Leptospira sp. GIMC2001 TaxID=1513297 RepID=UPI00234A7802|nr:bile acid:sodium symporter family protein [Leptospira sp. GIMC2001]WCL47811.1 bile acid:sodium symporter family protein [Leptospira sp. GIMC2001]